jgi:two-component system CheB/CheR fusion protein
MTHELSFHDLLQTIVDEHGVDLRGYKRTSLQRRLHKRMGQVKAHGYHAYLHIVRRDADEIAHLLNTILINVTDFFRDPPAWEFLRTELLPDLLGQFQPGDSVRAWCVGCATGQEAYSLAICLAEYFGDRLSKFDVKVYATDIDDEALTIARRGKYPAHLLRRLSEELRAKYFTSLEGENYRVSRELRRLVIFGKSNAIHDAPISRISVLLCRNMLIYFDSATQLHVLKRFHYALQPNGVLFLGKAESLLLHSDLFTPLHAKWRIFKKVRSEDERHPHAPLNLRFAELAKNRAREELMILKEYYQSILETVGQSIVVLDQEAKINSANPATTKVWQLDAPLSEGTPLTQSQIAKLCPELIRKIEDARQRETPVSFDCKLDRDGAESVLAVRVRPVFGGDEALVGTIIYAEDVTPREHLESTVAELENTHKELQSANEELETTNEELQSTNEELETMNEELQSTNEELETTNEELQSLNEELETMNEELQVRTEEMDQLNARYAETLERMPFPVMLLNDQTKIEFWNTLAMKLFGFKTKPAVQLDLEQLPISESARKQFKRKHQSALKKNGAASITGESLGLAGYENANVQFTCVPQGNAKNVLVMIERSPTGGRNGRNGASSRPRAAEISAKKRSAKKKTAKRR